MSKEKRYVAVVEFFVNAKDDNEAIEKIKAHCREQDLKRDDKCCPVKIVEQPFGSMGNRPVFGE